jgi:hypothetical protein
MGNKFQKPRSTAKDKNPSSSPTKSSHPVCQNVDEKSPTRPVLTRDGSQKKIFTEHLKTIPLGSESKDKVQLIRLINKSKFLQHPLIKEYLVNILDLMKDFKVTGKISDNIYNDYFSGGFLPSKEEQEAGLPLKKELLSVMEECEALDKGIPEDELYEEYKPLKIQQFRKKNNDEAYRKVLESLLFWRDEDFSETDSFCEIFDMSNCPLFTFISHRWSPGGKALGKHNELLLFLALSKEEYFWLDCCCSPQDPYSLSHGHTMQVIWNIGNYLSRCKNIACYYFIDGIDGDLYEKYSKCSNGLLYLYHLLYLSRLHPSVCSMIHSANHNYSNRLWCILERKLGAANILKPKEYDKISVFHALQLQRVEGPEFLEQLSAKDNNNERGNDNDEEFIDFSQNNLEIAIARLDFYHSKYKSSLECFSVDDIEPVTTLLYSNKVFPFFMKDNWPCYIDERTKQSTYGFRLPDLNSGEQVSYGWYYFHAQKPSVVKYIRGVFREKEFEEKYYFKCDWSNSPHENIKSIEFHVHLNCLMKNKGKKFHQYHPKENPQFCTDLDNYKRSASCLLCIAR